MMENKDKPIRDEFRGARIRVFGTDQDEPEEGRVFVWTKTGWFERIEGNQGNVSFTPVAESEEEVQEMVARDVPSTELVELGGEFRKIVSDEFQEEARSYRDTPEYDREEPEDEDETQEYHQHDVS
jgi:hypothetical protein